MVKTFLLDLPKEWVDMLDVYCTSKNIARTEFFRQLFNAWLLSSSSDISGIVEQMHQKVSRITIDDFKGSLEGTSKMIHALMPIRSYLDYYRDTKMYELMIPNKQVVETTTEPLSEQLMSFQERETLKDFADKMAEYSFFDESIMLKDISHWQRYLESNPGEKKTFLEYVDRKYTNPDLKTY